MTPTAKTKTKRNIEKRLRLLKKNAKNSRFNTTKQLQALRAGKLNVKNDTVDNLKIQLGIVYSMLRIAEKNYHEYPTDRNCYAVSKLIETASYLLTAIEERRSSEDLANDLTARVLQPFITDIVAGLSDEVRQLRDKIHACRSKKEVNGICENFMRTVGDNINSLYATSSEKILEIVKDAL